MWVAPCGPKVGAIFKKQHRVDGRLTEPGLGLHINCTVLAGGAHKSTPLVPRQALKKFPRLLNPPPTHPEQRTPSCLSPGPPAGSQTPTSRGNSPRSQPPSSAHSRDGEGNEPISSAHFWTHDPAQPVRVTLALRRGPAFSAWRAREDLRFWVRLATRHQSRSEEGTKGALETPQCWAHDHCPWPPSSSSATWPAAPARPVVCGALAHAEVRCGATRSFGL